MSGAPVVTGDGREPTDADRPHYSFSQLDEYLTCGRKYQLKRIEGIPTQVGLAAIGGSAIHTAVQMGEQAGELELQAMLAVFNTDLTERLANTIAEPRVSGRKTSKWPNGEDERWWREYGAELMLKRYLELRAGEHVVLTSDAVEMRVTGELAGRYVVGYIDALPMVDAETGESIIRDVKTGGLQSCKPLQLATYSVLYEQATGVRHTRGQFLWLRGAKRESQVIDVDLEPLVPLVEGFYADLAYGVDAGFFPMKPNQFCGTCDVRLFCDYGRALPEEEVDGD